MEAAAPAVDFNLNAAIIAPAEKFIPRETNDVRPDAMRVIFSPLVNITVSQKRQIPYGYLANIPEQEDWMPARDVPVQARHRVHPDPNDASTWSQVQAGRLPVAQLASVIVPSDLILSRVLKDYADMGCREIETLREKTSAQITSVQQRLFGVEQMRTHEQIRQAVLRAADQYKDDKLVIGTAREIMKMADEALKACQLYWKSRRIEMASGEKGTTSHADNFDLRICDFAGIDPISTEADALRADVLRAQQAQPAPVAPAGPTAEQFAAAMKEAVAEGVKAGIAAATAVKPEETKSSGQQGANKNGRN